MTVEVDTAYVLAGRTAMSPPLDHEHFHGPPGLFAPHGLADVLLSCTFTWEKPRAGRLAEQWQDRYPGARVQVGGPACGDPGAEFVPGRWLKRGLTITTRGCPGCASPCLVPSREGALRCLDIRDGWNVLDNNLLAAPRAHIEAVVDMLERQPRHAVFSGGLEARRLVANPWFVERVEALRTLPQIWTAYDCAQERVPALAAVRMLRKRGWPQRKVRCYVLVGRDDDTPDRAEARLREIFQAGALPFAMHWRDDDGQPEPSRDWRKLVRKWTRPAAIFSTEKVESIVDA